MPGPLRGLKVIDLTSVLMGPFTTQILGDLGAEVIKIEPPEGDVSRHVGPMKNKGMGAIFLHLNRNKKSVVIDLKNNEEKCKLLKLIDESDIFITNIRPRALQKLDLDYDSIKK